MKTEDAEKKYGDIIHLPHHVSSVHPHMPVSDRAAQFTPFAALTGYGDVIKETARLTDEGPDLSEDEKQELNYKIQLACALPGEKPEIVLTYFVQDEKKSGGACHTARGKIRRIDPDAGQIILEDGLRIRLDCVVDIEFTGQLSQSALWKSDMPME